MIKKISITYFIFLAILFPIFVSAQVSNDPRTTPTTGTNTDIDIKIPNPLVNKSGTLLSLINDVLNKIILPVASVVVVMWIIYAGFKYVTAQGNQAKVTEAHQRLLWSLIGAGIILGAVGISAVVIRTIEPFITH